LNSRRIGPSIDFDIMDFNSNHAIMLVPDTVEVTERLESETGAIGSPARLI